MAMEAGSLFLYFTTRTENASLSRKRLDPCIFGRCTLSTQTGRRERRNQMGLGLFHIWKSWKVYGQWIIIYMSDKLDFRTSVQCFGATTSRIRHPSKFAIPWKGHKPPRKNKRAVTRWVKGIRGLTYEQRLKGLKLQPLEKRRLRNDLVLTHEILGNQTDQEAAQSFPEGQD